MNMAKGEDLMGNNSSNNNSRNMINQMVAISEKNQLTKILKQNELTAKFGLTLTEEQALEILQCRRMNLKEEQRIEFREGVIDKLIFAFCDSPYIYQANYAETIEALQELFYIYKNECYDEITDDELIEFMRVHFNGDCQGSIDFLEESCLDMLSRDIRSVMDDVTVDWRSKYEEEDI